MKLGFIAQRKAETFEDDAKFAAEHGFQELELVYDNFYQEDWDAAKDFGSILAKHDVGMSAVGLWRMNHLDADPKQRAENHEQLKRIIEFTHSLGGRVVIAGGGIIEDASLEENVAEFVKDFPPILEHAEKNDIKIAMYGGHKANFFGDIEAWQAVWDHGLDVGVKMDPANFRHAGRDYMKIFREHGDKIYHMHIKEIIWEGEEVVSQPAAGMGDMEWGKMMAFLYEWDYDGCLSIEPHGPKWSRPPLREKMLLLTQKYMQQFLL